MSHMRKTATAEIIFASMVEKVSATDITKAIGVLQELTDKTNEAINHVNSLIQKVEDEQISTAKGVSFLELKYQLLLSYLVDLTLLMNNKVRGNPIKDDPSIDRLVEIRTVLEKIRPIDQKLKYQIDKLVKTAATGSLGENDPLQFKPNPEGLVSKLGDESDSSAAESGSEDEEEEVDGDGKVSKVYKPPRVAPMYYDGDMTMDEKRQKAKERVEKKIRSSRLMRDLEAELYDGPEEIKDDANLHRAKVSKYEEDKERYEEEYLMRRVESKKEKNMSKKLRTVGDMDGITKFGDISALTGEKELTDDVLFGKKRKTGSSMAKRKGKGKTKGGPRKKRRF